MNILAAQYLESLPPGLTPQLARERLRQAFDTLPLTHILLGWEVPPAIEQAVAEETASQGAQLYQWHPLLTGEKNTPEAWRTVNLHGKPIPGHHHLPEFTFLCPNHPETQDLLTTRIKSVIRRGIYQGLFLDRIRFPSPAASPEKFLGCFCVECRRAAKAAGFDLEQVRRHIEKLLTNSGGRIRLVRGLFGRYDERDTALETFLRFRADSVTCAVSSAAELLTAAGMATGLDSFSPSLAWMVGQDLGALDKISAWTKIMTYPHTYGPAGLPFELLGLRDWLKEQESSSCVEALRECSGLDLPPARETLASVGLPPATLQTEIELGRKLGITKLLAGLALVELPGINVVVPEDLQFAKNADGLVLSWDLWHISPEVLYNLGTEI